MNKPNNKPLLPLLLLTLSLTACGHFSPHPPQPPSPPPQTPPPPPELMTPPEPGLWSDNVRELLRQWLQQLTPSKPA